MKIREAVETDLPVIVEIYNQSISGRMATGDITPITVESRLNWYREHSPTSRPILVLESDNIIRGWLSFQDFYYRRLAYHAIAELSIYMAPEYQAQ
jgi:L-amino acid N-acyltransferase YncA